MKLFFILAALITLVFIGYHLTFRSYRLPFIARSFYFSGLEFLLLGILLGPLAFDALDRDSMTGLKPVMALLLGWAGMLFGFQFEVGQLRRFPPAQLLSALLEGLVCMAFVFFGVGLPLIILPAITAVQVIVCSLALAAVAACSAQSGLVLAKAGKLANHRHSLNLVRYVSSIDGAAALMVYGLVFFFRHEISQASLFPSRPLTNLAIFLAGLFGILALYTLLLTRRRKADELILAVIAMAVLASGMATVLNMSPLLVNFFIGVFLVNFSVEKERIFNLLIAVEKPVYLLILVFLGAKFHMGSPWVLLLATSYIIFRASGKVSGWFLVTVMRPDGREHPRKFALALIDQGGLPAAILLDFLLGFPDLFGGIITGSAIIGIVVNNIFGTMFQGKLFSEQKNV